MSVNHENSPELFELGRDHKELRQNMQDITTSIARLEGKIDTLTALLNHAAERQDRADTRIDKMEDRLNATQRYIWMGMGAISLLGVLPNILRLIGQTGG